jgi:hypothetical protein
MEVSNHLHVPAAFIRGKEAPVLWSKAQHNTENKTYALTEIRNRDIQPLASHYSTIKPVGAGIA